MKQTIKLFNDNIKLKLPEVLNRSPPKRLWTHANGPRGPSLYHFPLPQGGTVLVDCCRDVIR